MRMTVTGWDRNHGEKEIFDSQNPGQRGTWVKVEIVEAGKTTRPSAVVSHVAPMKLDGNYLIRMTFEPTEIANLFYKTHGHLPAIRLAEILSECKQREDAAKPNVQPVKSIRRV